jgi:hypothetical protein
LVELIPMSEARTTSGAVLTVPNLLRERSAGSHATSPDESNDIGKEADSVTPDIHECNEMDGVGGTNPDE